VREGVNTMLHKYKANMEIWKLGKIIQKFVKLYYQVKLNDGYIFTRCVHQHRETEIQKTACPICAKYEMRGGW
jgi:hypothetical protein